MQLHKTLEERTREQAVLQAFRSACWDLYVSNLPDPVIAESVGKSRRDKVDVPRGFFIDPKSWTITFNIDDIPKHIQSEEEQFQYARSIFQHEITHFTQVPADGLTEAVLVNSCLKGFRNSSIEKNRELARGYAYLTLNIFGDLVGDTLLAKERYGRDDYADLTVWRMRETITESAQRKPSLVWQALVSTYEKLWDLDLGLDAHVGRVDRKAGQAAEKLVEILGNDWRNRTTWESKIQEFARVLEPLIQQDQQEQQDQQGRQGSNCSSGGFSLPEDLKKQMGDADKSPTQGGSEEMPGKPGEEQANSPATAIDERVLQEIYERNMDNPGDFAGTMGALKRMDPEGALRLMYRARAKELLVSMAEKNNMRAEKSPAYRTSWQVGDPILGKGGLEVLPSIMASGRPVPGITTYKRKMEVAQGFGRLKMIPDLFIVIDSSGSMEWSPWTTVPEQRGDFDKAILAAEAAALYAIEHGGKVAVVNFSGEGNVLKQHFTSDLDSIEKAVMACYGGGTVVPVTDVASIIRRTENPLLTCVMTDGDITNWMDACEKAFSLSITEHDTTAVFNIGSGSGKSFMARMKEMGSIIYDINRIDDLIGMVIGQVKKTYRSKEMNEDG